MEEKQSLLNEGTDRSRYGHEAAKEGRVLARGEGSRNSVTLEKLTIYKSVNTEY